MPGPNAPYTQLDANQVLQQAFNEATDRLRVDASVTATIGDIVINAEESDIAIKDRVTDNLLKINGDGSIDANVNISASGGDNVAISDGTDTLAINPDGSINVSGVATAANQVIQNASLSSIDAKLTSPITVTASTLPLPTGAATESKQDSQITQLNNILSELELKANLTDTQPVSVSILPLPTGAATELKQDSQITVLNNINAGIPNALGQTTAINSMPVVLASDQPPINVNASLSDEPIKISGTVDGTVLGTEYGFVYNQKQQVLAAHDREEDYTYADFGTKDQRITRVEYASTVFSGITVRRDFNYTLVGTRYRRDSSVWSIV